MALDLSFKQLIDAAEDGAAPTGQPISIAIDRIDEDPGQPRRSFDEHKLEELAESVRQHGVLQPIVLRQATEEGRYVIVMGARRYRAAKRAGLRDIPAFIHAVGAADRYGQMIENIQRDDLNAPEIAAFIASRLEQGDDQADISRKLGKPRDWVSRYASVQSMPEFLRSKLAGSSIRAVCMNSTRLGVSSPTPSRLYAQHGRASPTPTPVNWLAKFAPRSAILLLTAKGPLEINHREARSQRKRHCDP